MRRSGIRRFSSARSINLAIIDGYRPQGRLELAEAGMKTAGQLFVEMFDQVAPVKVSSKILFPADDDFTLPNLSEYDAVAWTGSSLTIMETEKPEVQAQIDLCAKIREAGLPQFGSCWGAQLAAVAAGGACAKNPKGREMGFGRKIKLTEEGRNHPMYEGKPEIFDAYISHNDEVVSLGSCGKRLATNSWTDVQAVSIDSGDNSFWSVQYHPEYDLHEMARLTYARRKILVQLGFFPSEDDCLRMVDDMEELFINPNRWDLAWKLGIDEDILDDGIRRVEVRNWVNKMVIPTMKRKEEKQFIARSGKYSGVAMVLDVDGVLVRGSELVPGAKEALQEMQRDKIPFVFMTNGGGYTEEFKAKQYAEKFGIEVDPEQVIVSHTPMKEVAEKHKDDKILLVGKRYEKLLDVLNSYGLTNVMTTEEYHSRAPKAYPDLAVENPIGGGVDPLSFGAIFILNDPLYWGRDAQIVTDLVQASGNKIPVYDSCSDLIYATEYGPPRYGAGSFRYAVQHLVQSLEGEPINNVVFGKPSAYTYDYCEKVISSLCKKWNIKEPMHIFGVGDNLDTDIEGANRAGGRWESVLTLSGLYKEGEAHDAHHLVKDVTEALAVAKKIANNC